MGQLLYRGSLLAVWKPVYGVASPGKRYSIERVTGLACLWGSGEWSMASKDTMSV